MARTVRPKFDPTSEAAQCASDIIQPDTPPANASRSKSGTHAINIKPTDNGGAIVEHMPKNAKHGGGDYGKESVSSFTNTADAHAHVGTLLGIQGGKGHTPKSGGGLH